MKANRSFEFLMDALLIAVIGYFIWRFFCW